jgi:hypothetical protein
MYSHQAEQLTQETQIADLAAQNTTTGDSRLWQSQLGFLNGLGSAMTQLGGLCYASPNAAQQFKAAQSCAIRFSSAFLTAPCRRGR